MTADREPVSVGQRKLWGFIASFRPARYITAKGSALMSLDDFLLCVGKLPAYEGFSNVLELLCAFECVAPAHQTRGGHDHSWWRRDVFLHQVVMDRGTLSAWLRNIKEINQFDGSRWFLAEDWAYAIIDAMRKGGVSAEEVRVPQRGIRRATMNAKVTRKDGTFFLVRCS